MQCPLTHISFSFIRKSGHINPWFSKFALFCHELVQHIYFAELLYSIVYSERWVSMGLNLWRISIHRLTKYSLDATDSIPSYIIFSISLPLCLWIWFTLFFSLEDDLTWKQPLSCPWPPAPRARPRSRPTGSSTAPEIVADLLLSWSRIFARWIFWFNLGCKVKIQYVCFIIFYEMFWLRTNTRWFI